MVHENIRTVRDFVTVFVRSRIEDEARRKLKSPPSEIKAFVIPGNKKFDAAADTAALARDVKESRAEEGENKCLHRQDHTRSLSYV